MNQILPSFLSEALYNRYDVFCEGLGGWELFISSKATVHLEWIVASFKQKFKYAAWPARPRSFGGRRPLPRVQQLPGLRTLLTQQSHHGDGAG